MDFQYYETLMDKSDKKLKYFIENIIPNFTKGEMPVLLDDLAGKSNKNRKKASIAPDFIEIGEDYNTFADLSNLNTEQLEQIYKIFISKELNEKLAIKWRFYQYLKINREFVIESVYVNRSGNKDDIIDIIIETDNNELIVVSCYTILELESYIKIINNIIEFIKKLDLLPDKIIIAVQKTYRNIPINEAVDIQGRSIIPELWVEWVEINKLFNGNDLIIISSSNSDENIEVAGYNFTSTEDLLDFTYEYSDGGQVFIFKQISFFSESDLSKKQNQVELIWKGLMIK